MKHYELSGEINTYAKRKGGSKKSPCLTSEEKYKTQIQGRGKMKRKSLVMAVICVAVCFMMGSPLCFGAEPIKIGGIFALTGRAAHIGTSQRDAVLIAIDEVDDKGGINGR
jgi:ABC-type branched-subunit amino acid transport system substrate-binding protein